MDNLNFLNNNSSPYKIPSSFKQFKIGTLNVRSECKDKMIDILHKITQHNIYILFINEINIKATYGENDVKKYVIENINYTAYNESFKFIVHTDSSQPNSGCGFIIHESIFKYIAKINVLSGRLIHLIFTFKKLSKYNSSNSLHLIGIYGPQKDEKHKPTFNSINEYITKFFAITPFDHHHVILGDFNINGDKFNKKLKNKSLHQIHWHDKLLYNLHSHNYNDCALLDNKKTFIKPTYYPHSDINGPSSRIDYIFCNPFTFKSLISYHNIFHDYISDHSLIFITLHNNFIFDKKQPILRDRQSIDRINYKKVTAQLWDSFNQNLSDFNINNIACNINDIQSVAYLNFLCNNIEKAIISNTTSFPKIIQSKKHIDHNALLIKNIERIIHRVRTIGSKLLRISKHPLSYNLTDNIVFSFNRASIKIIHQAAKLLNKNFNISFSVTTENLNNNIDSLNHLYNSMRNFLKKTKMNNMKTSIDRFINIRNENYKSNPGKMLDSLLNRDHKRITLDKLIINNNNTSDIITDQVEIERRTVSHFQNIGSSSSYSRPPHDVTNLPDRWKDIYCKDVPDNLKGRSNLTADISLEELSNIIKLLPNNKATGPSKISYEMIKHLPLNVLHLIIQLFNLILKLNTIPER